MTEIHWGCVLGAAFVGVCAYFIGRGVARPR